MGFVKNTEPIIGDIFKEDKYMFKNRKQNTELNKDQIIDEVFEIDAEEKEEKGMIAFLKRHRKGVIFTLIGTALAAGAGIAYSTLKSNDPDEIDEEAFLNESEEQDQDNTDETIES